VAAKDAAKAGSRDVALVARGVVPVAPVVPVVKDVPRQAPHNRTQATASTMQRPRSTFLM